MTDFTRRTLRTWAVGCGLHGLALALLAALYVPWKSPVANVAALAYAALVLAAAPGLWRCSRAGWWLGVAAAGVGLLGGVTVVSGLLISWAFLRSAYGELGTGMAIGALLIAAVAFQLLGLVPALLLRALLRREIRADLGVPGPPPVVGALFLLPLLAAALLPAWLGLSPVEPLSAVARAQALAVLRAAVDGTQRPAAPALSGLPAPGPLYVTLYRAGRPALRVVGHGSELAEQVAAAADRLAARPPKGAGRLKVDRVVAVGPLPEVPLLVSLGIAPGLDGLRRRDAPEKALLPDDLVRTDAFGAAALLPALKELRAGLDAATTLKRLPPGGGQLQRFRTEGFVEHQGQALPAVRGNTPGAGSSPEALRAAALAGGEFLLRQEEADGQFRYRYLPYQDRAPKAKDYSLPRHAGAIYALSQLHAATGDPRFGDGAQRALAWLSGQLFQPCGAPGRACVVGPGGLPKGPAALGPSALALVAYLRYQLDTGDARFEPVARALSEQLLHLQRPDGEFFHRFDPRTGTPDPSARVMFASEQAALAFVLAHKLFGEERFKEGARRALDWLTTEKYAFFLGRFVYGADHWTCLAAAEAFDALPERGYLEFCEGYCGFIRRLQFEPGGFAPPDFSGHYGFSTLLVPQAPGTAGFTEAVVATTQLATRHGVPAEELKAQALLSLEALVREQLREDNSWLVPAPASAAGGIRRSLVESEVRLDFTQHAASALLAGAGL